MIRKQDIKVGDIIALEDRSLIFLVKEVDWMGRVWVYDLIKNEDQTRSSFPTDPFILFSYEKL